ncbi:hypothetical protein K402DRAFT_393615 [Aulographum hederae CBS 113979]|uniref:Uncharacterized protein n=1 Tax=Aulographum hederae CBS 113979 TaxID=1176131 RepID=A0A6G1H0H5_9PEZI|nr:hypothetical protein K402DRAFT_393615 [Aulographum hederae CBS 113979]
MASTEDKPESAQDATPITFTGWNSETQYQIFLETASFTSIKEDFTPSGPGESIRQTEYHPKATANQSPTLSASISRNTLEAMSFTSVSISRGTMASPETWQIVVGLPDFEGMKSSFSSSVGSDGMMTQTWQFQQDLATTSSSVSSVTSAASSASKNSISTSSRSPSSSPSPASSNPAIPTAADSPTVASPQAVAKSGMSTGAVAGIAIGSAVAGALIGCLLFWLCAGKSRRRKSPAYRGVESQSQQALRDEKSPVVSLVSPVALRDRPLSAATVIEDKLPPPLDNAAILGEMSEFRNMIKSHVENFYSSSPAGGQMIHPASLHLLGYSASETSDLHELLLDPETALLALRSIIATVITPRLEPSCNPMNTLLPPEIVSCMHSMSDAGNAQDTAAFRAHWRTITAHLIHKTYIAAAFAPGDPRLSHIRSVLELLVPVLKPYMLPSDQTHATEDLSAILRWAAGFGLRLFAQPKTFRFDWEGVEGGLERVQTAFPGLVVEEDEVGRRVERGIWKREALD